MMIYLFKEKTLKHIYTWTFFIATLNHQRVSPIISFIFQHPIAQSYVLIHAVLTQESRKLFGSALQFQREVILTVLVGGFNPSEKYESQWGRNIPHIMGSKIHV